MIEKKNEKNAKEISINQLRVLIGHFFSIYQPCFAMDLAFSLALRMRGTGVVPVYCDSIQHVPADTAEEA